METTGASAHAVLTTVGHVDKAIIIFVLLVDDRHAGTVAEEKGERREGRIYEVKMVAKLKQYTAVI